MSSQPIEPVLEDKVDPMLPAYFMIIYFSTYTFFGFTLSFISEYYARKRNPSSSSFCSTWLDSMGDWREYYHSFALHVLNESTAISAMIAMYCVCEDLYGTDINEWKVMTRQPKPGMILLLSSIIWIIYKLGSIIYLITIDIFSWTQVALHIIDCNYLYEMFIAHSQKNKNPVKSQINPPYIHHISFVLYLICDVCSYFHEKTQNRLDGILALKM